MSARLEDVVDNVCKEVGGCLDLLPVAAQGPDRVAECCQVAGVRGVVHEITAMLFHTLQLDGGEAAQRESDLRYHAALVHGLPGTGKLWLACLRRASQC